MKFTEEQFNALIRYIDAAIEQKTDNCQSSDEGLCSSIEKSDALAELKELFT